MCTPVCVFNVCVIRMKHEAQESSSTGGVRGNTDEVCNTGLGVPSMFVFIRPPPEIVLASVV